MVRRRALPVLIVGIAVVTMLPPVQALPGVELTETTRLDAIRRAQVWTKTDVAAMDVKAGPAGPFAFRPGEHVTCDFVLRPRGSGSTLKFGCLSGPDRELKIRYGDRNGEVYAQVAATRLLWALGFGANRMYPVVVSCRGCTADPWSQKKADPQAVSAFDPATVDERMAGKTLELKPDAGWSWKELDLVEEAAGGASAAERDALKLLAVLVQHSSNKHPNQRLLCLDKELGDKAAAADACGHPFMMITDLGKTFGRANTFNKDAVASVNFKEWSAMTIWKEGAPGCAGNLPGSFTGTLHSPVIGEPGRQFLADLLVQLTDAQLHDIFDVARFPRRDPSATVDDWVRAFKQKRAEIVNRTCGA